jgi:hypothetical protein
MEYELTLDEDMKDLLIDAKMFTTFPSIHNEFLNTHFSFCKDVVQFNEYTNDQKVIDKIESEFGNIFILDFTKDRLVDKFVLKQTYDLDIKKMIKLLPNEPTSAEDKDVPNDLLKRLKGQRIDDGLIDYLQTIGLIKKTIVDRGLDGKKKRRSKKKKRSTK